MNRLCWTVLRAAAKGVASPMERSLLPRLMRLSSKCHRQGGRPCGASRLQAAADDAAIVVVIEEAATELHIVQQALFLGLELFNALPLLPLLLVQLLVHL